MASPGYTVNNLMSGTQQNISTAATSATAGVVRLLTPASASKRVFVWEIDFGQSGPPNATDCSVQWVFQQVSATAAGTVSSTPLAQPTAGYLTAGNIDLAVTTTPANYTAAPTTQLAVATFYAKAINQRGAGFWQAAPGGEIYFPVLASTGPLLLAYSATYASTVVGRLNFSEI
jgi:hypothetical protein